MKNKSVCILLTIFIAIPLLLSAQVKKETQFDQSLSWSQIKAKAQAENKYIFIDVFATWCGPCKLMDRDVYPNDTISQVLNNSFVPVKLQMDSTGNDDEYVKSWYPVVKEIGSKYKIRG